MHLFQARNKLIRSVRSLMIIKSSVKVPRYFYGHRPDLGFYVNDTKVQHPRKYPELPDILKPKAQIYSAISKEKLD